LAALLAAMPVLSRAQTAAEAAAPNARLFAPVSAPALLPMSPLAPSLTAVDLPAPAPLALAATPAAQPAAAAPAAYAFDGQRLRGFLAQEPLIRIAIPSAPNNGHQAIAATIAKRVRELGFSGRFEFIYDGVAKEKLDVTMPGFDPKGPDTQELPALGAVAMTRADFKRQERITPATLAISAAEGEMAGEMHSGKTARMEPFRWGPATPDWRLVVQFPVPKPEDSAAFVATQLGHSDRMREKIPGVQALTAAMGKVEMMPAYDLPGRSDAAFTLLKGLHQAQTRSPDAFSTGVVMPMFSHFSDADMGSLVQYLRKEPGLFAKVRIVSVQNAGEVESALAAVKKGEILIVRVGGVTQNVFEYFYSKQTLPGAVSGANGQNMMYVLGLPYLNTTLDYTRTPPLDEKNRELFNKASNALYSGGIGDPERVADFILAAKDPSSGMAAAFAGIRPKDDSEDKVARVLDAAVFGPQAPAGQGSEPAKTVSRVPQMRPTRAPAPFSWLER
jgi:hypothetical protein